MARDAKRDPGEFLVQRAFDPVLKARTNGRPDAERARLKRVGDATRAETGRHGYGTAREVVMSLERNLRFAPAKKVHAEPDTLRLLATNDSREESGQRARDPGAGT